MAAAFVARLEGFGRLSTVNSPGMCLQAERRQLDAAAHLLRQCAASCELALKEYISRFDLPPDQELSRTLIPAIATLRTAADVLVEKSNRQLALRLAHKACSDAASECRSHGLDEPLLRCAGTCDHAVDEIELLLTALIHD